MRPDGPAERWRAEMAPTTEIVGMEWVSARTGVPINTLRYYRQNGTGPKGFKLGRRVVYDVADVEAWINEARASEAVDAR